MTVTFDYAYLCRTFEIDVFKRIVSPKTLDPCRRSDPESCLKPNGVLLGLNSSKMLNPTTMHGIEKKQLKLRLLNHKLDIKNIRSKSFQKLKGFIYISNSNVTY